MSDEAFHEKNLLPISIVIAGLIVAGTVFLVGTSLSDQITGLSVAIDSIEVSAGGTEVITLSPSNDGDSGDSCDNSGDSGDSGGDTGSGYNIEQVGKLGSFIETDNEICMEDGKPVVYLFSTTWCSHCSWVKETFDAAMLEAMDEGKVIAYHWELDTGDNTLTEEVETEVPAEHDKIYRAFNPRGSIPTFVFGCKYYRIGNGYESANDLDAEKTDFETVIETMIA